MDLEWWKIATVVVAATGQSLFVVLYFTFPWHKTFLGRALFFKAFVFALMIDVAVASLIWDWNREESTLTILYGCTAVGIWGQLIAFGIQRFGGGDRISTEKKREYHHGT